MEITKNTILIQGEVGGPAVFNMTSQFATPLDLSGPLGAPSSMQATAEREGVEYTITIARMS